MNARLNYVLSVLVLVGALAALMAWIAMAKAKEQNRALMAQIKLLKQEQRIESPDSQAQTDELLRLRRDKKEILRLRNEVTQLRELKQELEKLRSENQQLRDAMASGTEKLNS